MCECDSCEIVFASRSKRWRDSGDADKCAGRTLTATVRSRRVSRALYTSPMPPAPIGDRTSYGPSREPADRVIYFLSSAVQLTTTVIGTRAASSLTVLTRKRCPSEDGTKELWSSVIP